MSSALLYLLKANVALLLFAAAYFGLLRRLTFFTLNRFYLVFVLLFSAVYPALPVPALFSEAALPVAFAVATASAGASGGAAGPVRAAVDWETVALVLYVAGAAVLLARLLGQLLALRRVRRASRPAVLQGQPVRTLAGEVGPFSFGRTIYLNPARHPAAELAAVLRHEQVHVRQWHTLDVLLAHVAAAAAWCNPAAWLLRRALLDNLEYLADHAALQTGLDRRAYQYSLLRLSQVTPGLHPAGPALVSHFTFPTLKKRVAMMNTPLSSTGQLARYFVAGPLVLALALGFAAAQAQGAGPKSPLASTSAPGTLPTNAIYYADGQLSNSAAAQRIDPQTIASIDVVKGDHMRKAFGNVSAEGVVVITTKANAALPAAVALREKISRTAPAVVAERTEEPVAVSYLAAPALVYITQKYPGYRLTGVSRVTIAATKQVLYKAQIAVGRRPLDLLFDEKGQLVPE